MKVRIMPIMMALLMVMSAFFTGCGKKEPYAYEIYDSYGTINGETIDYQFVYFATRCEQASIESYYYESLGKDMWSQEIESGKTMEESVKETIAGDLENMLVLELFAEENGVTLTDSEKEAIATAADDFMKNNSEEAIEMMGATKEIVEKYLSLYTISNKMYESIVAQADTDFDLEEYKRSRLSYIKLDREEYLLLDAQKILDECKTKYDELTGEDGEFEATERIFGINGTNDLTLTEDILTAMKELKDGEVYPDLFVTEDYYMIVRLVSDFDTEASASAKEYMIENAEQEKYEEVLASYKEEITYEVNTEAWDALKFDIHFAIVDTEK